MPEYDKDGKELTVDDMVAYNKVASAASFAEIDEAVAAGDVELHASHAVEGQDVSGFRGVSQEYRTYASEVDAPLREDWETADNSDERLAHIAEVSRDQSASDAKAKAEAAKESDDTDADKAPAGAKRAPAKKSAEPPIKTGDEK